MYPNITWPVFEACNENQTSSFEEMCRRLFTAEYLKNSTTPHVNDNLPGIEVLPALEPPRDDSLPQRRISFQSKYVGQTSKAYSQFKDSARKTIKNYRGDLDAVYLFCNKPLNTDTKGYHEIESIHKSAGIDTIPVTNGELLDLIFKYPGIYDYYFKQRYSGIGITQEILSCATIIPIGTSYGQSNDDSEGFSQQQSSLKLLKDLVDEKLNAFYNYALSLKIHALAAELDKLYSKGIDGTEYESSISYYKYLVLLHNGEDYSEALSKCSEEHSAEANWLADFYVDSSSLSHDEFLKHTPITQVFVIEKLFSLMHWDTLISLYDLARDTVDSAVVKQLDFFAGLSLINKQENDKASGILHSLYEKTRESESMLFAVCADIRKENALYQNGMNGHHEALAELVKQLDSFNKLSLYKQNEHFIAATRIEAAYHLGMKDKSFLEDIIEHFSDYSISIQNIAGIRYAYALCLEVNGSREEAIKVYEQLDWKEEPAFANRYMLCLILSNKPKEAIDIYAEIKNPDVQTEAIYLRALAIIGDDSYEKKLKACVESHKDSLQDLAQITHFVHDDEISNTILTDLLRTRIAVGSVNDLPFYVKEEFISYLAQNGEIELVEIILSSIGDLSTINSLTVWELYNALFAVSNREYNAESKLYDMPEDFKAAERISDRFINEEVSKRLFLQVKILCVGAQKLPLSFLSYSKQFFDITSDEESARNIVMSLYSQNRTDPDEYNPYLAILEDSEYPESCITVAFAWLAMGRNDTAEYYAYKALYYLNEAEDIAVYQRFLAFCNHYFRQIGSSDTSSSVKGNSVVKLERVSSNEDTDSLEVCLDSETDYSDHNNRSMGIEHLSRMDRDYMKILSAGLGQVIKIRGTDYKVSRVFSRIRYGQMFILKKVYEKPEEFKGIAQIIKGDTPEELVNQLKELADDSEHTNALLCEYHFQDNPLGLPIDALVAQNPDRYLQAVKYLLFKKDEALYAGEYLMESSIGPKYVLTLSTLSLLAILSRLDVLDAFRSSIIIPESYIAFSMEQFTKAKELDQLPGGTLILDKGKPVIIEHDKSISGIWESILDFCDSCERSSISDKERIEFNLVDGYSGERFIAGLRLATVHLDALILARRENAALWCDDLFFRKLAHAIGLEHTNTAGMVVNHFNLDLTVEFVKGLSKTNYIYVPIRARTDEEYYEVVNNLLDGEKKKKYHTEMIKSMIQGLRWMIENNKV